MIKTSFNDDLDVSFAYYNSGLLDAMRMRAVSLRCVMSRNEPTSVMGGSTVIYTYFEIDDEFCDIADTLLAGQSSW